MHNVQYLLDLMRAARSAIIEDRFPAFAKQYFHRLYGEPDKIPPWVVTAMETVGIDVLDTKS
jgi:queuine tRNA-ribosyltransferase catalytic subunit